MRTGTDATIAEHIAKIVEREYAMKQREGQIEYLIPSTLGIGLVEGYNAIGFENSLTKPHLRRLVRSFLSETSYLLIFLYLIQTEYRMQQICDGTKTKREVIDETLDEYREVYVKTKQEFATFVAVRAQILFLHLARVLIT